MKQMWMGNVKTWLFDVRRWCFHAFSQISPLKHNNKSIDMNGLLFGREVQGKVHYQWRKCDPTEEKKTIEGKVQDTGLSHSQRSQLFFSERPYQNLLPNKMWDKTWKTSPRRANSQYLTSESQVFAFSIQICCSTWKSDQSTLHL